MSIFTVFDAQVRQERGWDFPGYPEGTWTAGGVASHDASGGDMVIQVNLATAGIPEGNAYSIEAMDYETNNNAATTLQLSIFNFEISAGLALSRGYELVDHRGVFALIQSGQFAHPWFLGKIVNRSVASAISLVVGNTTGKVSTFSLSGYFWTPRSILQAEGGYRRPPDGLYAR